MRTIILESHLPGMGGWGNGYVVLPIGHKYHRVNYDNIHVEVSGGLTFGSEVDDYMLTKEPWSSHFTEADRGSWVIGFDTLHYGDDIERWPKEAVQTEADNLLKQLK